MAAARAGLASVAVTAIRLVWPTSPAATGGALPSSLRTAFCTWALVTSCSSVCTSVEVTGAWLPELRARLLPTDWTSSWAVAEYGFWPGREKDRLTARPRIAIVATHHLRRRSTAR